MNERRIWKMSKLAMFEEGEGHEDLSIAAYYRRDYVGLGLLVNFFLITIAYCIIIGAIILVKVDFLIKNFDKLDLSGMITKGIIGYILALGLYSVLVFTVRRIRYERARSRVKKYYKDLNMLYEEINAEKKNV